MLLVSDNEVRNSGSTRNTEILERRTLFTVYLCLGFSSEAKEARIFHFLEFDMLDALRIVIELKKVKADGLKVRQDNRAPIVGASSITPWMMFSRVRWLKHQFFLMLDITKLRSIQYQDAESLQTIGSQIRQIWQQNFPPI